MATRTRPLWLDKRNIKITARSPDAGETSMKKRNSMRFAAKYSKLDRKPRS